MAADLPLNDPLPVVTVYWNQFVLHEGAVPYIANLYTETCTMLQAGLQETAAVHVVIGWVGTMGLWLDLLPHLFAALDTLHRLPRPWEDSIPDLHGTELRTT